MRRRSKDIIQKELIQTRERLVLYQSQEKAMLGRSSVQSYTIGSKSLQRYQTSLADIQKMIDSLQKRINELEAELAGQSPRYAVGVVPRDW